MDDVLVEIHEYIDGHIVEHINKLRKLVKQPSISVEKYGTIKCAGLIRNWMKRIGFNRIDMYAADANPIVYGQLKNIDFEKGNTLLIYGAYDSNPVEDHNWSYPPFEGTLIEKSNLGTCLVARGVNNKMKISGILNAIDSVKHILTDIPLNLIVVFDGEEEMFSPTLARYVIDKKDLLKQADALYMPFSSQNSEGVARVQLGYKGILYLELESVGSYWGRGPSKDEIHSMHRPVVDNPIWHLISALSTMTGKNGNDVLIEGFHDDIKPRSQDFMEGMTILAEKFNIDKYKRGLGVENLISDVKEPIEVLKRLFSTSQINIDGIWGGYTGTGPEAVIPTKANAKIEVRLIPDQKPEKIFDVIKQHFQRHGYADIKLNKLASVDYCQTSHNEAIVQALIRSYELNAVEYHVWPSSLATIPISLFNQPPLNLPFATGCVGYGGSSHGSDEYSVIEGKGAIAGVAEYEKVIASVIYEFNKCSSDS